MGQPQPWRPRATDARLPVCILGMGRSGTSLAARVIGLLGIELGPEGRMLPAAEHDNAKGYWEQGAIRELNDDILSTLGGTWWQPPRLEPGWERDPRLKPHYERARAILDEHYPPDRRWGWKDPRTSLLLPFWRSLLGPMVYVVCLRDPADVARSLHTRDPVSHPIDASLALWLQYTAAALDHTSDQPRLLLSYEDWFDDDARQLQRLADFICGGDDPPPGWEDRAREFLDVRLRHHDGSAAPSAAPAEIRAAHRLLRELTRREGEVSALEEQLRLHRGWLEDMQASRTWRMTEPVRALARTVHGSRRSS